jgi:hypothetical protein
MKNRKPEIGKKAPGLTPPQQNAVVSALKGNMGPLTIEIERVQKTVSRMKAIPRERFTTWHIAMLHHYSSLLDYLETIRLDIQRGRTLGHGY